MAINAVAKEPDKIMTREGIASEALVKISGAPLHFTFGRMSARPRICVQERGMFLTCYREPGWLKCCGVLLKRYSFKCELCGF